MNSLAYCYYQNILNIIEPVKPATPKNAEEWLNEKEESTRSRTIKHDNGVIYVYGGGIWPGT